MYVRTHTNTTHKNISGISGTLDGNFNLAFGKYSSISKLTSPDSPPILRGRCGSILSNPWQIRQSKCSPICAFCQIAKLDVHRVYHFYGKY